MTRLSLPHVTLCAATSVNVAATVEALRASMEQVAFADSLLFSDSQPPDLPEGVRHICIPRLKSGRDYSDFMLGSLAHHIGTSHCLVVQWDGFVLDATQWDDEFLKCDYIGAPWPQFTDGHDVGNGGFSLRSSRLLAACSSPGFLPSHPEDVSIARLNRDFLERERGIIFAHRSIAERFAFERSQPREPTFGFHGIFNMIPAIGPERFWELYRRLDDRGTAYSDVLLLGRQLLGSDRGLVRAGTLVFDRLRNN